MFAKCDPQDRVYAPLADIAEAWGPVLRVSSDGKTLTTFSLYTDPELAGVDLLRFALGSDSSVYLLAGEQAELQQDSPANGATEMPLTMFPRDPSYKRFLIVKLDTAGKHVSKLQVSGGFAPLQFAVMATGHFLIAGSKPPAAESMPDRPVLAIFDPQGKLTKELEITQDPRDPSLLARVPGRPERRVALKDWGATPELGYSTAEIDDDGTTYFASPEGSILRVSPAQEQARLLSVPRPAGTAMMSMKVAQGRMAVSFGGVRPIGEPGAFETVGDSYAILDPVTLEVVAEYRPEKALLRSLLVCYSQDTFSFLYGLDPSGMKLLRARPK